MSNFEPDKSYSIGVWDITFCVIDTEAEELLKNKDGTVKQFRADNYDCSYISDSLDVDDLEEAEPVVHLYKGRLVK